jgi:hypothetical protein
MIEALNDKKMVSFRLSIALESPFRVLLAKQGVKAENVLSSFIEALIAFDEKTCPDYTSKAMEKIVERARQIRESKFYRQIYRIQQRMVPPPAAGAPPFEMKNATLVDEESTPEPTHETEIDKGKNEDNHKNDRSGSRRKALRRS